MSIEDELQEAAENGSLVVGTKETLKESDSLEKAGEEAVVETADADNHELGALCMRPFSASVVGLK
ncbi:MAG: hypothetical protein SVS85_02365 [Candidatus Nanohaloarchaea archaeon]|nr:hypothetical protein [Candidatus Nanohaloarchaea archaeon]